MAQTVRNAKIDTRSARSKLAVRREPHWTSISAGCFIGYRRGSKGGTWIARFRGDDGRQHHEALGAADDARDADGISVFDFRQAQGHARDFFTRKARELSGGASRITELPTVREAVKIYIGMREAKEISRKGSRIGLQRDTRSRLTKHVLGDKIADERLDGVTEDMLEDWRKRLSLDLAQASVMRLINDFKAALNAAAKTHRGRLPINISDIIKNGLASTEAFGATAREAQVLPDADVRRVIEAAAAVDATDEWDGDLLRLIIALAATGARFSQVIRIRVIDVQPQGRLMVPVSRKGRGTKQKTHIGVPAGEDVMAALRPITVSRKGSESLFERWRWRQNSPTKWERDRRGPWIASSELGRPWAEILKRAGMPEGLVPYSLRHSSIVRGLRAGLPVRLVAALHDTSSKMIEKHYAAYIVDAMDELAARAIVPLTSAPVSHVRPVEGARG